MVQLTEEMLRYTEASQQELEELIRQHAAKDYGTGIYCLDNSDYYDQEIGITFEPKDYFL